MILKPVFFSFFLLFVLIGTSNILFDFTLASSELKTITVPDDYESIQDAVNAANSGDIILVKAGIYNVEWISIDKSISLVGENQKTLVYYHSGQGFIVTVDNVRITGFTLTNFEAQQGYAVSLTSVTDCVIENNVIKDNIVGIYVYGYSSGNTITGNFLEGNERSIELINAQDNTISENNITSASISGISLDSSSGNTVTKNRILNLKDGMGALMLWMSSDNTISRNLLFGGNLFLMVDCSNNILSENFVIDSNYGVFVGNSSENTLYSNYFINVTTPVLDSEMPSGPLSENNWDNGVKGNYWSSYTCQDANDDGVGDSIQILYENNQDNYPLMKYPTISINLETDSQELDSSSTSPSAFPIELLIAIVVAVIIVVAIAVIKLKK